MFDASTAPEILGAVRRRVTERTGITVPEERLTELARAVDAEARAHGASVSAYAASLAGGGRDGAIERLAATLLVHETYFFRGRGQLDLIVDRVLDEMHAAEPERRLRVLSAGASYGAEAYSIAILLQERRPELVPYVAITGIDLSPAAVDAARRGRYSAWALRQTPAPLVARWFRRRGDDAHELLPAIREMVRFEVRNLLDEDRAFWSPDAFDVILCRNVLIYLDDAPAQAVFSRLERALSEGGYVFLSPEDMLRRCASTLGLHREGDVSYYHGRSSRAAPRLDQRAASIPKARAPLARPPHQERAATLPELLELVDRGDLAHAERACAEAGHVGVPDARWTYIQALCRERAGDVAGARRFATTAAYLDPTFAMPCVHLAMLAQQAHDTRTARREFARAIALLTAEDEGTIALFGGGLAREDLLRVCHDGLAATEEGS